ncbi:MAG: hypothetical protein JNM62_11840 [Flavobacteriales bacterium]|nr:hypothetical protein [Flavobacteriales bacterium]
MNSMEGWLDEGDVWLTLNGGTVVGVPFALEGEVHVRTIPPEAGSIFPAQRAVRRGYRRCWMFWNPFTEKTELDISELRGQRIVDVITVSDERYAYITLGSGSLISMNSVAPHGTGAAGVELVRTLRELEERWGGDVQRLSQRTR